LAPDVPWRDAVLEERRWRNDLYLGAESPLAPDARAAFKGLQWWPLDPRFRAPGVRLARHPAPLPGRLAATGADAVELLEVGAFSFELAGAPCRLLAYEPAPGEADEPYILIPFRDATSAKETYGGGRYLDLEPAADDVHDLDFNRAYHPYCAYDEAWACVLPPRENRLPVRVEAGERLG
jgi:uncharacterized protein (DUF1684 family)